MAHTKLEILELKQDWLEEQRLNASNPDAAKGRGSMPP